MSRRFQQFVDNFMKGAALGTHWLQLAQQADDRKEQRAIARERNRITLANHQERMAMERAKMAGTQDLQRAQADWYRRRSAGGSGGGGGSAGAQQFINEMGSAGIDVSEPAPRQQPQAVQMEEPPPAQFEPTATDTSDDAYARGGRVRGRNVASAIMTGAQRGIGYMNRPPSPGAVPTGPMPTITRGASTPVATGDPVPLQASAGTNGPGSGFGDTAAPPVTTAITPSAPQPVPDMTTAVPDTSAFDTGYGMDMANRGGRIRGPKRPHVRGYQEGGSVEDSRKVDDQTRRTRYRQNAERAGLANDPLFDRPIRREINRQIEGGEGNEYVNPPKRYADGGAVIPEGYVDDPSLSPEERQARWKAALFPPRNNVPFDQPQEDPRFRREQAGREERARLSPGPGRNVRAFSTEPPPRGNEPSFYGETDRAQEGAAPGSYPALPEGDMPLPQFPEEGKATSAGGKPPAGAPRGGGRGAISTRAPRGGSLWDQNREAAYDPIADAADPGNIGAVDREGRTQPWVNQRVTMDDKGQVARIDNPATDYTTGAAAYATALAKNHPAEVYNGAGAADPRMMDVLMKGIDPEGKMPVSQRMETATKIAHEYYMQQGQPAAANQVAGEITQYGVQQSRNNGVAAMKAIQQGDVRGAVQQLVQGFDWLPNGQHGTIQGNNVVVTDNSGKTVMTIPITPQTVQNLALGMATGKLGWDAMGYNPTPQQAQPPTPSRPAAQPSAAPAGPTAQPQAAPAQAVQTNPPAPAAPQSPPRQTGAAPPPAAPQAQAVTRPPEGGATQTDPDEERLRKNPRAVLPGTDRATAQEPRDLQGYMDLKRRAETQYMKERQQIMARGAQLLGKGESRYLTQALQAHKARFDAHMKELNEEIKRVQTGQQQAEQHDVNVETRPRDVSLNDEVTMQGAFSNRLKAIEGDPALRKNTVLENLKSPQDRAPLNDLARQIWQQNRGISMDQAMNYALGVTSIKPEGEGFNLGTGKDATQFRTRRNQRGGLSLELPSGEKILVDKNTYNAINNLQRKNWTEYEKTKKKAADEAAEKAKLTPIGRGMRAIMEVVPQMPAGSGPLMFPRYMR